MSNHFDYLNRYERSLSGFPKAKTWLQGFFFHRLLGSGIRNCESFFASFILIKVFNKKIEKLFLIREISHFYVHWKIIYKKINVHDISFYVEKIIFKNSVSKFEMNEIFLTMKSQWRNFKPKNNDSRAN